jgi:hypothetical protein
MFGMSADEFIRNQREMFHDRKFGAALEAAAQPDEAAGGADAGGGLGDLGADLGGDDLGGDLGGGDDLGDLGGGGDTAEPAAEPAGDEGETTLLAEPPAKRDDDAKPRGRYEMKKKPRRPRTKQKIMNQATSGEIRGSTARTTFPGGVGYGALSNLYKEEQDNKNLEEEKLFSLSNDIKQLLESLTRKEDKHEAQ